MKATKVESKVRTVTIPEVDPPRIVSKIVVVKEVDDVDPDLLTNSYPLEVSIENIPSLSVPLAFGDWTPMNGYPAQSGIAPIIVTRVVGDLFAGTIELDSLPTTLLPADAYTVNVTIPIGNDVFYFLDITVEAIDAPLMKSEKKAGIVQVNTSIK